MGVIVLNQHDEMLVACRQLKGWTMEEATRPIEKEVFEFEGEKRTLYEWCGLMGLHHEDTYLRIIRGDKLADIIKE